MAKGRKSGPSRMDKRREAEAYEKKQEEVEREDEEEEEEESDESDAEAEDGDEEKPKKKAKKPVAKKPAAKKPATKRSRAAKEVRLRAVWIVYDNASKVVEEFPYNQKAEAEAFLAKKLEEKKGTFYLNRVKKEIKEEK
ncbi:MAG: hypothetical protein L0241_18030 [Planctomycetia bacterium]|nr:hypothetical protein [Planctomycetia bacterium]